MSTYRTTNRRPTLRKTFLRKSSGGALAAEDLSGATSVSARVRERGSSTTKFKNTMTAFSDGSDGIFDLAFTANQLDTVGTYEIEYEILWSAGVTETPPQIDILEVKTKFADPA